MMITTDYVLRSNKCFGATNAAKNNIFRGVFPLFDYAPFPLTLQAFVEMETALIEVATRSRVSRPDITMLITCMVYMYGIV